MQQDYFTGWYIFVEIWLLLLDNGRNLKISNSWFWAQSWPWDSTSKNKIDFLYLAKNQIRYEKCAKISQHFLRKYRTFWYIKKQNNIYSLRGKNTVIQKLWENKLKTTHKKSVAATLWGKQMLISSPSFLFVSFRCLSVSLSFQANIFENISRTPSRTQRSRKHPTLTLICEKQFKTTRLFLPTVAWMRLQRSGYHL